MPTSPPPSAPWVAWPRLSSTESGGPGALGTALGQNQAGEASHGCHVVCSEGTAVPAPPSPGWGQIRTPPHPMVWCLACHGLHDVVILLGGPSTNASSSSASQVVLSFNISLPKNLKYSCQVCCNTRSLLAGLHENMFASARECRSKTCWQVYGIRHQLNPNVSRNGRLHRNSHSPAL